MTVEEMQEYWSDFSRSKAFRHASSVPDWQTKCGEALLVNTISYYAFRPKEKDAQGKYIIVKADLQAHVCQHLVAHILEKRRQAVAYRQQPFLVRAQSRLTMLLVTLCFYGIPAGLVLLVLHGAFKIDLPTAVVQAGIAFAAFLLGAVHLLPIVNWFIGKVNGK